MRDEKSNSNEVAAPEAAPIPSRRRLIKAAATAPLIATLPNGAALANASASQCVIDSKAHSDEGLADRKPAAEPDNFVRMAAQEVTYTRGEDPTDQETLVVYRFDVMSEYLPDGSGFDPTMYDGGGWMQEGVPVDVIVLQIFSPDYDATGDPGAPTGVHYVNFWPVAKREQGNMGNMGITGTCLCSVDPGVLHMACSD